VNPPVPVVVFVSEGPATVQAETAVSSVTAIAVAMRMVNSF
jgi:hypothetical protein